VLRIAVPAEDLRTGSVADAMTKFAAVIDGEAAIGEDVKFSFPSLKNMVTCHISQGSFDDAKERYRQLLGMLSRVTANLANEAVDTVLEAMNSSSTAGATGSGLAAVRAGSPRARASRALRDACVRPVSRVASSAFPSLPPAAADVQADS